MNGPLPSRPLPTGVPSPCINVCQMDAASGLCLGCLRTLDEIACWGTLDDADKLAVWDELDRRRAARAGGPAGAPR
jgi:predicted Fe-S protein YdhL (DUF1289 family)